ncbi:MAG TPA: enolase C-terminal domain-like protein [Candidatus Methylacidiphilales bacterium]|nr:enolase C-terminal domain-like protein [Candidatus Methylacidiphilales bacterium]
MDRATISDIRVSAYTVPTASPESDGTLEWDKTTLVLVELLAADQTGLGYSYADLATAKLIDSVLAPAIRGRRAFDLPGLHTAMRRHLRNLGQPGISAMAISAIDNAAWDLKAKLLRVSLLDLLGAGRDRAEIYGSGGFTSYSIDQLQEQLGQWAAQGIKKVKMKIGRDPAADRDRVRAAREAIGPDVQLFVDANGAYPAQQAIAQAQRFAELGVVWFEEPVSSDDLQGLRFVRDHAPAGMNIAAGEYGYQAIYFQRMLEAGAVDVLQADATRCGGITGFLQAAGIADAFHVPFSFHCAPAMHASAACAAPSFLIGEYFFDHSRIEDMFFDGVLKPKGGFLEPRRDAPGFGLEFKRKDAERYLAA